MNYHRKNFHRSRANLEIAPHPEQVIVAICFLTVHDLTTSGLRRNYDTSSSL